MKACKEAELYPNIWDYDEEEEEIIDELLHDFEQMKVFYKKVLEAKGHAVVSFVKKVVIMDKARKKELLKAYADEQRQSFKDNLPMDEELFWNLFDYVDEKLETNDGCDHSLTFTREFLEKQSVDVESVLAWIINEGGGCDCEVLYNVEERFEE